MQELAADSTQLSAGAATILSAWAPHKKRSQWTLAAQHTADGPAVVSTATEVDREAAHRI